MRCFVAGGTGVIGRRAVPALIAAGHEVTVVSRSPEKDALVTSMGAVPVRVDLFDAAAVKAAAVGHDAVLNLATHIPPMTSAARAKAWVENDRIRTEGAANLAAAAAAVGAGRYVQESITFPYADGGTDWITEDHPRPASPYTEATNAAEGAAAGFTAQGGAGVVLRFAQFHAPDAGHVRTFAAAFARRVNPLVGPAAGYTSFIGMDAAARAVVAALTAPAGIYNVADDDPPTRAEVVAAVAAALGTKPARSAPVGLVRKVNSSADVLMRSHRISHAAFTDATGWQPDFAGTAGIVASITAAASVVAS